jgi:hypothetical protein
VAEQLHSQSFLGLALGQFAHGPEQVGQAVAAFLKVWAQLDRLRPAPGSVAVPSRAAAAATTRGGAAWSRPAPVVMSVGH